MDRIREDSRNNKKKVQQKKMAEINYGLEIMVIDIEECESSSSCRSSNKEMNKQNHHEVHEYKRDSKKG